MREGHHKLAGFAFLAASVLCGAGQAQDGNGRSDSVARPSTPERRIARRTQPRVAHSPAPPPVRRVELGRLALSVNEGDSRVEITRIGEPEEKPDVIPIPARSSSLILRTLPAGTYRIAVTKYGYEQETVDVEIADGKRRRVSVVLKPKLAVLSVGVSAPDALIEIEKAGTYQKQINKLYLKPGRYRVNVTRRGYLPHATTVDLDAPGREENLQIVMRPQRIDEVLDDASAHIANGNYDAAGDLARDVLVLNAAHARANLIYGLVEIRRGGPDSTSYLLRAIRNGETFRFPVKLQEAQNMRLFDAELALDRDGVSLKSPARFDLDFTIPRGDVEVLNFSPEPAPGSVFLSGRADFHGRPIKPALRLHPHDLVGETGGGTTRCGTDNCGREITVIGRLLESWRGETSVEN